MTILFVKFLLAHFIGDFILQPTKWVIHKKANKVTSRYLYLHILIHAVILFLVVWNTKYWPYILAVVVLHYLIDVLKIYVEPYFKLDSVPFFVDQALHIVAIFLTLYFGQWQSTIETLVNTLNWPLLTAVIFVTFPSGVFMQKILQGFSNQIELDHKSLAKAGQYIGILERLFVLGFIVMGRWEAIGLLIAAKSVFRFNDLKERNNRKLTEYILIGTLLSFGLAMLTGVLYSYSVV